MKTRNGIFIRFMMIIAMVISVWCLALSMTLTAQANDGVGQDGDNTPPTLNGAINNGLLRIQAFDESGIKVIYVNGYEFYDPLDGILNIRLEKFEAGKQYFTIAAMDNAGNRSEDFSLENPYWTDPNADNQNGEDPADALPADASPTNPAEAKGTVIDHVETDPDGNLILEEDFYYTGENDPKFGREFYTVQTASGKIFYLIIERNDEDETVHFLTDITENDLLNATSDNSNILPKNSLATSSGVPVKEVAIPAEDGGTIIVDSAGNKTVKDAQGNIVAPVSEENPEDSENIPQPEPKKKMNPVFLYIIIGAIVLIVGYYVKIVKPKKKTGFIEDEEEEEQKEDEIIDDEVIEESNGYFDRDQSDEEFFEDDTVYQDDGGSL
ncbi:MAG: DUF4366 domain-containing protein [Lachnospiraceae bacterium]|nr:DUF4366 domain-containing protein [Lachnospiraceae bacterium]